jgi:hypothetical protein
MSNEAKGFISIVIMCFVGIIARLVTQDENTGNIITSIFFCSTMIVGAIYFKERK